MKYTNGQINQHELASYRGAQQHHFGITDCGTGAGGLDAPFWHPVEQQEKEASGTKYTKAYKGQSPTAETVALQLLRKDRGKFVMWREKILV